MFLRFIVTMISVSSAVLVGALLSGCNANAWMADPAAVGYYKPTPTTIPILDRIDIIEDPVIWPELSDATAADLMPSDLRYKIVPGDTLDVKFYGLYAAGQFYPVIRRVDQGGFFRVPEVGDVLIAGLTVQAAQDLITEELAKSAMSHPSIQVDVLDQTGFTYTIYGGLARWGVFTLVDPNLLLLDALAQTGGVPQTTNYIYVIRQLPVSDSVLSSWDRGKNGNYSDPGTTKAPVESLGNTTDTDSIPTIEDLINQLDIGDVEPTIEPMMDDETETPVLPGILQSYDQGLIDIDDLVPSHGEVQLPVDVDELSTPVREQTTDSAYIYVPESDTWIPVSTNSTTRTGSREATPQDDSASSVMLERIIAIPWKRLRRGDSSFNIVIRPDDRIYVEPPPIGNIYIRGEVGRPGVYEYPITGEKITLSQLITAAGDLGPVAVPEKVSITRRIGENLEATVTLNFAAILQHTEPDIFLKPNDHISVGTSWGATPMAIIRNGFRTSYGFGFLLDRNFGNDVFGAPPTNRFGN